MDYDPVLPQLTTNVTFNGTVKKVLVDIGTNCAWIFSKEICESHNATLNCPSQGLNFDQVNDLGNENINVSFYQTQSTIRPW